MKRIVLLGIAVLFVSSMAMAADIDIDADGTISGDYSGDNIHIGVNGNANVSLDGDLQVNSLVITDTTVGAMGSLTIGAGYTVDAYNFNVGMGFMGSLDVQGTLNVGHFGNYDDNGDMYNPQTGVYGQINVTGQLNGGDSVLVFGGYNAAYQVDVNISGSGTVAGGMKPVYIGGVAGNGSITMSGNASLVNYTKTAGLYDNMLNVGWNTTAQVGVLTLEATNTCEFRHFAVRAGGTVNFVLDAAGNSPILQTVLPPEVDPETENVNCNIWLTTGSVLNIDTTGVAAGILVEGFAIDIASASSEANLAWDAGDNITSLTVDGVTNAMWELREKPGDASTLQARIVPEPTTMALLGIGGLLAALRRRS